MNVYAKTIREDVELTSQQHINVTFPQLDVQGLRLWAGHGADDLTFMNWEVSVQMGVVRQPVVDIASGDQLCVQHHPVRTTHYLLLLVEASAEHGMRSRPLVAPRLTSFERPTLTPKPQPHF